MKLRSILWELAHLLPVSTTALFCWLWLAQVVPAQDTAEWITAIATVAALAAAVVAAGAAFGQLRLLRLDAEERAKDARLAHARAVYFVTSAPSLTDKTIPGEVVLYNNSMEPVDHIELHLRTPGNTTNIILGTTLTPTGLEGQSLPDLAKEVAKLVTPWQWKKIQDADGKLTGTWGSAPYEMRMTFRDAAGRSWLRREGHGLTEIVGDKRAYLPNTPLSFGN